MTTTNASTEAPDLRELSAAEMGDIAGGAISLGTWLRRLAWQMQNAPAGAVLVGCSDNMSACSWQSN